MVVCSGSIKQYFFVVVVFFVVFLSVVSLLVMVKLVEVKGISVVVDNNIVEVCKVVLENVKWVVVE